MPILDELSSTDARFLVCNVETNHVAFVERLLEIVGARTNCVTGSGALPYERPPENVRLIREYPAK